MNFNFEKAIQQGINASIDRERNIEDINNLIATANQAVLDSTDGKIGLAWRIKSYNTLGALANISFNLTDVNIEQISKQERVIYIKLESDASKSHDLTLLIIQPDGFPCEMNVNGNKLIAHDIEALGEGLESLLGSVFFGQKVRNLLNESAKQEIGSKFES